MRGSTRTFTVVSAGSLLALSASGIVGCNPSPPRPEPSVDCEVTEAYEFSSGIHDSRTFEPGSRINEDTDAELDPCPWFGATDDTGQVDCDHPLATEPEETEVVVAAAGATGVVEPVLCNGPRRAMADFACELIPDGPRCGSDTALRLTASRNNDWGNLWADWTMAQRQEDVSQWEGIAFWARAEHGTQRSFTLLLNDKYTANITDDDGNPNPNFESACVNENVDGGTGNISSGPTPGVQTGSGNTIPGAVPSEDACGNSYDSVVTVTNHWELYTLPFDEFRQEPLPNRRLKGFDAESFRGIIIRAPKDVVADLWIDDLAFYRRAED